MNESIDLPLNPRHLAMLLEGSGISPHVITARGYRTVTTAEELERVGFAPAQRLVPGLLVPIHNTAGVLSLHAYRPDTPRASSEGRVNKYEFPAGSSMVVDVPPTVAGDVRDARHRLFVTEGAKKADSAVSQGLVCIDVPGVWNWRGNAGDAGKMTLPDWDDIPFTRRAAGSAEVAREVVLAFDSDVVRKAGVRQALDRLAEMLRRRGARVRYLLLPDGDGGSKVGLDDFFAAGGTLEELEGHVVDRLPEPDPEPIVLVSREDEHPALHEAALHGVMGDVIRLVAPQSESDPAAILFSLLVGFGNLVGVGGEGRGPRYMVESTAHHANLFACLVGASGTARKGTSWNIVRSILSAVDHAWGQDRIKSGLSSGEGLLFAVRDKEPSEGGEGSGADDDKRILVVETEMAQVLKVLERDGNTLSAILRNAWDTGHLSQLVKNNPLTASNAHVSILGHITQTELRRRLGETEMANGFANRFLWVCVRRSQFLPEGGQIDRDALEALTWRVAEAARFARDVGTMRRDAECTHVWASVYPELTRDRWGLYGAVTSRAEAQVLRLSMLYALLDKSVEIRTAHLEAALALWDYCDRSAKSIFGTSLGDPVADRILQALRERREEWVSATDISDSFKRHVSSARIEQALQMLLAAELVRGQRRSTGGRPTTEWKAK